MANKQGYLPFNDPNSSLKSRTSYLLLYLLFIFIGTQIFPCGKYLWRAIAHSAPPLGLPDNVQRSWGQYSPWFPAGKYSSVPRGCEVTQVNILHRHGARYPNGEDDYDGSVRRLLAAPEFRDSRLFFLRDYRYNLGQEELTAFGAAQSFESGHATYHRYSHLINQHNIPFIRSSGLSRVVYSSSNWTVGFAAASSQRYNPKVNVIIPESQNNSLKEGCPRAGEGTKEKNAWLATYAPPILKRLRLWAPGVHVTDKDVFNLMAMCPFETIALQKPSGFCGLFTDKEFLDFEYHGDIEKYYKTGYGEPLGPIQGVGYVNELISRLTGLPVVDHTQHNASLPFPLSRSLYADFTHENLMVAVYSVIGLYNITDHPLHVHKRDKQRSWVASRMVPFSARMVIERLTCASRRHSLKGSTEGKPGEQYVRILVNDEIQPLHFCGGKHGLCTLDSFVASQGYTRRSGDGDFEKCYS